MPGAETEQHPGVDERLRGGDPSAFEAVVRRDYALSAFLAEALAAGPDVSGPLARAWARLAQDVRAGGVPGGVRAALVGTVIDVLDEEYLLDTADVQPPAPPAMLPAGDRWAQWWAEEPSPWPDEARPGRDDLLRALRRLPVGWRALVVMRDVAGLTADEAEPLVQRPAAQQNAVLDAAREALVTVLDEYLGVP